MKVIDDEVNKIDYNSEIILTNTTTGKKLIIPKETPKPTNFFNIPCDIRNIIYNKVRDLKRIGNYKLLEKGYLCIGEFFTTYKLELKNEQIDFIDSDDEQEEQNFIDTYNKNDKIIKNIEKLKNRIIQNDKNLLSFKSNIIQRREEIKYYNSYRKDIIITYKILYNETIEDITSFINNLNLNILENDNEYIKIKYNNYHILNSDCDVFDNIEKLDNRIDYLELYKKEFGEDENIRKLKDDFNNKMKIINSEFADSYGEYLARDTKGKNLSKDYKEKFKKLFFDKVNLIKCEY